MVPCVGQETHPQGSTETHHTEKRFCPLPSSSKLQPKDFITVAMSKQYPKDCALRDELWAKEGLRESCKNADVNQLQRSHSRPKFEQYKNISQIQPAYDAVIIFFSAALHILAGPGRETVATWAPGPPKIARLFFLS